MLPQVRGRFLVVEQRAVLAGPDVVACAALEPVAQLRILTGVQRTVAIGAYLALKVMAWIIFTVAFRGIF
jgi:hypothetical protein